MTGNRMTNLAKTPVNLDFQSKYYKPNSRATAKSVNCKFDSERSGGEEEEASAVSSLPSSPPEESSQEANKTNNERQYVSLFCLLEPRA